MTPALNAWWSARDAREQLILKIGALLALLILLVGLLSPISRAVSSAQTRLTQKQKDLAWIQSVEPRLAATPMLSGAASNESLVTLVNRTAQAAGVGGALRDSAPSGAGALRVRFEGVAFDNLAGWLAQLTQSNGIHIVSATLDSAATAGAVNASLVLNRN